MPIVLVPFVLGGQPLAQSQGGRAARGCSASPEPAAHRGRRGWGWHQEPASEGTSGHRRPSPDREGRPAPSPRRPALSLEVAVWSAPLPSPPPLVTQRPVTCASGGTRSAPPRARGTDASDFTAASRHPAERMWRVSKLSAEPADEACAVPEPAHRQMRPGGSSCPLRFPRFGSDCPGRVTQAVHGVSQPQPLGEGGGPGSSSVGAQPRCPWSRF